MVYSFYMAGVYEHQRILAGELLAWHVSAGVDAALDDQPHNWFEESLTDVSPVRLSARAPVDVSRPEMEKGSQRATGRSAPLVAAQPTDDWVREARSRAAAANHLDDLRAALASFEGCALSRTAKSLILAPRAVEGGILVMGDAPEADDDRSGEAFSGRAGVLLDAMLGAIGLKRDELALTTAIPWRPPGNRAATAQELDVCLPFLIRQIELVKPRIVLSLGALPVQLLAGRSDNILKLRGQWFAIEANGFHTKMMASLSPAYLLRQPLQKRFAWRDLKAFRRALIGNEAG